MPPRPSPSRVAAALDFFGQLRDRAGGILNTVASTPGTLRPDEYQERFGLSGDPVPAPREVGRTVRGAATRFTSLDAPQNPTFAEMAAETGASFVPGVGQFLAARDIERARRADDPAGMAMAASNFLPVDRLIGALRHGLGRPPISELDVYHGTPHTYAPTEANPLGEFDASKIGAGEGAQAYGHGIYLAESPSVAKSHRLAGSDAQHRRLTGGMTPMEEAAFDLASQGTKGEDLFSAMYQRYGKNLQTDQDFDAFQAAIRNAESSSGNLLKADLPDEMIDRMLDWDKPLSEQSEAIKKAMGNRYENWKNSTGQDLYEALSEGLGGDKETSNWLRENGIPGIKYLDAGSRGQGGSGTRNFVVFPGEEKKVRILERNGQPAPERIAQALEAASTETPSNLVMPFTERKTAAGRAALKNLHKEQGVTYKDWSFERGGAHTPAGPNSGSPAFDVTMNGTYPDDFYGVNGLRYYGTGYDALDAETYMSLQKLAGRPNFPITVYRAVEKDAKGKINPGDWVTTSRAYAKEHGQSALGGNFKIVKSTVYAKDIWTSGDSMLEWGYHPQGKVPEIKWR